MGRSLNWSAILIGATLLVAAVAWIIRCASLIRRAEQPTARQRQHTEQKLAFWGATAPSGDQTAWDALIGADVYFTAWWSLIVGLFTILGLALLLGAFVAATARGAGAVPSPSDLIPIAWPGAELFALLIIVGAAIAYIVANGRVRAAWESGPNVRYHERREVTDYVSPLLWAAWVALLAATVAVYLYAAHIPLTFTVAWLGTLHLWTQRSAMIASLLLAVFLMLFGVFSAQYIVTTPAIPRESGGNQEDLNDIHRAEVVAFVVGLPIRLAALALILLASWALTSSTIIFDLACLIAGPTLLTTGATNGRLGGRLTGWWGQPQPKILFMPRSGPIADQPPLPPNGEI